MYWRSFCKSALSFSHAEGGGGKLFYLSQRGAGEGERGCNSFGPAPENDDWSLKEDKKLPVRTYSHKIVVLQVYISLEHKLFQVGPRTRWIPKATRPCGSNALPRPNAIPNVS